MAPIDRHIPVVIAEEQRCCYSPHWRASTELLDFFPSQPRRTAQRPGKMENEAGVGILRSTYINTLASPTYNSGKNSLRVATEKSGEECAVERTSFFFFYFDSNCGLSCIHTPYPAELMNWFMQLQLPWLLSGLVSCHELPCMMQCIGTGPQRSSSRRSRVFQ